MSDHHEALDGLKSIQKLVGLKKDLVTSLLAFDQKVFEEGALSAKVKELIAIEAAPVTQCPGCIEGHVQRTKRDGGNGRGNCRGNVCRDNNGRGSHRRSFLPGHGCFNEIEDINPF